MKNSQSGIWIGQKDLNREPEFLKEAQEEMKQVSIVDQIADNGQNLESSRRDFLKYLGFGLGAATVAASCDIPVKRAIPYVVKPEDIVPGVATYYASAYVKGGDFCSVLVKTREGRPIKIEGNSMSNVTKGGTSARAQASVLSLYDVNRLRNAFTKDENGKWQNASWRDLDSGMQSTLKTAKNIRIVTNTVLSPTAKKAMDIFVAKYPGTKVVTYDPVSSAALLEANERSFGDRVVPNYHFDKADLVVSFNADFLGTWISPVEYAHDFAKTRNLLDPKSATMSRLAVVESHMSLTGSNADNRILVKPSAQSAAVAYLYNEITGDNAPIDGLTPKAQKALKNLAGQLIRKRGKSLVVCGNNNVGDQILVNAINNTLDNVGHTLSFQNASLQRQGDERELTTLISEMKSGAVDALIVLGANPAYDSSDAAGFAEGMANVKMAVALTETHTETSALCNCLAPVHHTLESWGDVEAKRGMVNLIQPTISPLFNTRQGEESLLCWAEADSLDISAEQPYLEFLKNNWKSNYFGKQNRFLGFLSFWDSSLRDGVFEYKNDGNATYTDQTSYAKSQLTKASNSELEISFFETVKMGNGQFANNPWLQELPDPVTRTVWNNYLAVPVNFDGIGKFVGFNNLKDGDIVSLTLGAETLEVPVVQQFGQMPGTVALSLGYGRTNAGFAGTNVGVDVNKALTVENGLNNYYCTQVAVSNKKGEEDAIASVQYHHTMGVKAIDEKTGEEFNADEAATVAFGYGMVDQGFQGSLTDRSIIRNTNFKDLGKAVEDLHHEREHHEKLNQHGLYPWDEYVEDNYSQGHWWGMHIDLNACTGCGACAVACVAENNVPVVGKKQVSRHQEMTWLRIDRYFYGDAENPNTVYQPMMCQHCDNAPCENVCPVNATNHSSEGLNQMAYNRCVGTRYCANNCPFKVRRFNWLDYTTADIFPANQVDVNGEEIPFGADNLTRMVLNPDVTVRARGVIEKCSFCVQRIQEGKLVAKKEGRALRDADVRSACQTACPTGAITFGDRNNKNGDLGKKLKSPLNYIVLEETNVRSSVQYTMKVNNKDESLDA